MADGPALEAGQCRCAAAAAAAPPAAAVASGFAAPLSLRAGGLLLQSAWLQAASVHQMGAVPGPRPLLCLELLRPNQCCLPRALFPTAAAHIMKKVITGIKWGVELLCSKVWSI